ncbi:MAG: DUF1109 family protein [Alphaproteobacteria bacterium]|nr:DUF1109 family protein [Alphaproteobacteria bacterium]
MHTDELINMLGSNPPEARGAFLRTARTAVFAMVIGAILAVAVTMGLRHDLANMLDDPHRVFKYGFLSILLIANGLAWWRCGQPGRNIEGPVMFVMLFSGWLLIMCVRAFYVTDMHVLVLQVMDKSAIYCVGVTTLIAAVVSVVLLHFGRGMAPPAGNTYGYVTALFAASIGAFAYGLHCPHDTPLYLATWYGMAITGFAAIAGPFLAKKLSW